MLTKAEQSVCCYYHSIRYTTEIASRSYCSRIIAVSVFRTYIQMVFKASNYTPADRSNNAAWKVIYGLLV